MDYGIRRFAFGTGEVLAISSDEYKQLADARERLLDALFLEQKFDLLIEDFLEWETELLSSTARYMVHGEPNSEWFAAERSILNRRFINLLAVCRGYIDHSLAACVKSFGENSADTATFKKVLCDHYDQTFGYRAMEAMRNYVMHRGFPIHALEFEGAVADNQPRNRLRYTSAVYTKTTYLMEGGKLLS